MGKIETASRLIMMDVHVYVSVNIYVRVSEAKLVGDIA